MSLPERAVIDASVAVKWYVEEPGSPEAAAILASGAQKMAPDLIVSELGNVVWKKVRRGELTPSEAAEIAAAFTVSCPLSIRPAGPLLRGAMEIALEFGQTVYDSLYLALAVLQECPLITADTRLVEGIKDTALEGTAWVLSDVQPRS